MKACVLALDQGTTSSRAIVFDRAGQIAAKAQRGFTQIYPRPGWVEHDPLEIWQTERDVAAQALRALGGAGTIAAVGITNQRETTVVWDRATGLPIHNAIVWQCRRTAELCDALVREHRGVNELVAEKTGLRIDAYFSGTKLRWLLDNVPGARARAERGELLFGTVETWLIWKLTGGAAHVTDYSNASRTMLFNIHTLTWDEELCRLLDIPLCMLPRPVGNSEVYGVVAEGIEGLEALAGVPVCGAAGDQQSALFGQGCFERGQAKNTYGTGCFTLMNVGQTPVRSRAGLVTSVAWSVGGRTTYALEGSVFNAGSAIQWLRDELRLIDSAPECDRLAESVADSGGVYLVPAFTGLGAPYWDMYARGCIVGMTRGTSRAHIARAVLEAIAFQVTDLMTAMRQDALCDISLLRVDGGASVSDVMMQLQADLLRIPVDRPAMVETTAFGAAALAGLAVGVWKDTDEVCAARRSERVFLPQREQYECEALYRGWKRAVNCACGWVEPV
ncbi:MAG: glycerol kinase GlpK [Oscillospiraceae bacterium]|nr:glycerol kinase GlpK [Oscillospiraceae bacterium]